MTRNFSNEKISLHISTEGVQKNKIILDVFKDSFCKLFEVTLSHKSTNINDNIKIDDQKITDILTVNGVRFSLEDGSWGLIRASSNKPSLVIVTESPTSDKRKKKIFDFIDELLKKTGKVGAYDQKI